LVAALGSSDIAIGVQQISPHPVQLRFMEGVMGRFDELLTSVR
jgi:hypothetical protein